MKQKLKWGIAGIGKLGTAILTQFDQYYLKTGIYHPDEDKAKETVKSFSNTDFLQKEDLQSLEFLILALPADQMVPLINDCKSAGVCLHYPVLINMATSLRTDELQQRFPDLTWLGMKVIGHSESLKKYGDAVFVTEKNGLDNEAFREAEQRFARIGQVVEGKEALVEKLNKSATYHAIKAAKEAEKKMGDEGFSDHDKKQAIQSVFPEVIRAYSKGELGGFAREIAKKTDDKNN